MPESFIVFIVAAVLFVILKRATENKERGGGRRSIWRPKKFKTGRVHGIWLYDSSYERDYIRYAVELDRSIKSIRRYDEVYGPKPYYYRGKMRNYYPDFVVRHVNGRERIIETKGHVSAKTPRQVIRELRQRHQVVFTSRPPASTSSARWTGKPCRSRSSGAAALYEPGVERGSGGLGNPR